MKPSGHYLKWVIWVLCTAVLFFAQIAAPVLADDAADVLALVNQERAKQGLAPLTLCARLNTVAQNHTNDMIARQFFSHTNPDGKGPGQRMTDAGYNWNWEGENIAVGYSTAQEVVDGWMKSPGHKANILNTHFVHLGVGTGVGDYNGFPNYRYWTQDFGAGGSCGGQNVDLGVTINDSPDPVSINHNLTYSVVVTNNFPMNAAQTALSQFLPSSATFVSAIATQGSCSHVATLVSCNLGAINASGSVTIIVIVTPLTIGSITSTAFAATPTDNDANVSNNSASATTTTAPPPPGIPSLIAPLAPLAALRPTFSWAASSGAVRYEIQIGTTNPPTTLPISVTTTAYTPPAPMLIGNYFWRVRAFNSGGVPSDDWSNIGSFRLDSPDGAAPELNYFASQPVTLTWNRVLGASSYDVEIANNPAMTAPIIQASTTSLFYSTSALTSGTYYWRVRAKFGSTPSSWSSAEMLALK